MFDFFIRFETIDGETGSEYVTGTKALHEYVSNSIGRGIKVISIEAFTL